MTTRTIIAMTATAAIAGAIAFGFATAAPRADRTTPAAVAASGVSKADFDRLEGEVQDLQRRVAALEKGGGTGGHKGSGGHVVGDSWENP